MGFERVLERDRDFEIALCCDRAILLLVMACLKVY